MSEKVERQWIERANASTGELCTQRGWLNVEGERCGRRGRVDKSKERIIGRRMRESDHGDVDGSSRLNDEFVRGRR